MEKQAQHRLVILGSMDDFQELVRLAKKRGIYTICCDGYPNGVAKTIADKSYTIDIRQADQVAQMCINEKADGIITSFSDLLFEQATLIADKAGLPWYAKPDVLRYYREKDQAKAFMTRLGIHVPRNIRLSRDFSDDALANFTFPVVIKPLDSYGSKGIYVVESATEIRQLYSKVLEKSCWDRNDILIEEYCQGREYNIMSWIVDGKVYTISLGDREKNPRKGSEIPNVTRMVYPARAFHNVLDKAVEVLQKFADGIGQKSGPLSMQFFMQEDATVYVCEIAGRLFGYEEGVVEGCCGLCVEELLLDEVYNKSSLAKTMTSHNPFFQGYYASLYFIPVSGKQIKDLTACYELCKDDHVMAGKIFYQEGEFTGETAGKPYLARYYLKAASYEELDRVTQYFYEKMHVSAVDGSEVSVRFFLS